MLNLKKQEFSFNNLCAEFRAVAIVIIQNNNCYYNVMEENPTIDVVSVGTIHHLQISTPCNDHTSALAKLEVFVWGFPAKNIYNYPEGKPVEDCYLSRILFLFLWKEKAVKGVNI